MFMEPLLAECVLLLNILWRKSRHAAIGIIIIIIIITVVLNVSQNILIEMIFGFVEDTQPPLNSSEAFGGWKKTNIVVAAGEVLAPAFM